MKSSCSPENVRDLSNLGMFSCRGGFVVSVQSYVSHLKKHTNTIYYKGNTILKYLLDNYWLC